MWINILLKQCVLTNVAEYNHIPCFGYALILAIKRLATDFTDVQYEFFLMRSVHGSGHRECNTAQLIEPSISYFSIVSNKNSTLIVVDTKDRTNKLWTYGRSLLDGGVL